MFLLYILRTHILIETFLLSTQNNCLVNSFLLRKYAFVETFLISTQNIYFDRRHFLLEPRSQLGLDITNKMSVRLVSKLITQAFFRRTVNTLITLS